MKKYIKVKVQDRKPDNKAGYEAFSKNKDYFPYLLFDPNDSSNVWYWSTHIDYWLEEVKEDEVVDLLQEAIDRLGETKWEDYQIETFANFCMNAQNVVWNHLNNAPNLLDDK